MSDKEYELTIESDDSQAIIMYNVALEDVASVDEPIYLGVLDKLNGGAKSIGLTIEQAEEMAKGLLFMVREVKAKVAKETPKTERELQISYINHLENKRYGIASMFHALTYGSCVYAAEGLEEQAKFFGDKALELMFEIVDIDKELDELIEEVGYDYRIKVTTEEA
jgi:hypothetical protein